MGQQVTFIQQQKRRSSLSKEIKNGIECEQDNEEVEAGWDRVAGLALVAVLILKLKTEITAKAGDVQVTFQTRPRPVPCWPRQQGTAMKLRLKRFWS